MNKITNASYLNIIHTSFIICGDLQIITLPYIYIILCHFENQAAQAKKKKSWKLVRAV